METVLSEASKNRSASQLVLGRFLVLTEARVRDVREPAGSLFVLPPRLEHQAIDGLVRDTKEASDHAIRLTSAYGSHRRTLLRGAQLGRSVGRTAMANRIGGCKRWWRYE